MANVRFSLPRMLLLSRRSSLATSRSCWMNPVIGSMVRYASSSRRPSMRSGDCTRKARTVTLSAASRLTIAAPVRSWAEASTTPRTATRTKNRAVTGRRRRTRALSWLLLFQFGDECACLLDHLVGDAHVAAVGEVHVAMLHSRGLQLLHHVGRLLHRHRLIVVRVNHEQRLHGRADVGDRRCMATGVFDVAADGSPQVAPRLRVQFIRRGNTDGGADIGARLFPSSHARETGLTRR